MSKKPEKVNPDYKYRNEDFETWKDLSGDLGVQKLILKVGEGTERAKKYDNCEVFYKGFIHPTGREFDSSESRDQKDPTEFELGSEYWTPGWHIGVGSMLKGEKCLLRISPEYAYKDEGYSYFKIKADQTLVYEIELVSFVEEEDNFPPPLRLQRAHETKEAGNKLFKEGKFDQAREKYNHIMEKLFGEKAIETWDPEWREQARRVGISVYCNLCLLEVKAKNFLYAVQRANEGLEGYVFYTICLDGSEEEWKDPGKKLDEYETKFCIKYYYRRCQAYFLQKEYEEAMEDLLRCKELEPGFKPFAAMKKKIDRGMKIAKKSTKKQFGGFFNRIQKMEAEEIKVKEKEEKVMNEEIEVVKEEKEKKEEEERKKKEMEETDMRYGVPAEKTKVTSDEMIKKGKVLLQPGDGGWYQWE